METDKAGAPICFFVDPPAVLAVCFPVTDGVI
jgi:hypothetical protein